MVTDVIVRSTVKILRGWDTACILFLLLLVEGCKLIIFRRARLLGLSQLRYTKVSKAPGRTLYWTHREGF